MRKPALNPAVPLGLLLLLGLFGSTPVAAKEKPSAPGIKRVVRGPLLLPILPRLSKEVGQRTAGLSAAVERGLAWLAAHQDEHGGWGVQSHAEWCHGKRLPPAERETAIGYQGYAAATTALALNAFMEAGHTPHGNHAYARVIRRGLAFLVLLQSEDGGVGAPELAERTDPTPRWVYSHAFGTWALVRAYGLTGSPRYQRAAQEALRFSAARRIPYSGWGYADRSGRNDTSITACMLLGLEAARRMSQRAVASGGTSPLSFDKAAFEGGLGWVKKIRDPDYGNAGYNERGGGVARYQGMHDDSYPRSESEACTAMASMIAYWGGESFRKSRILPISGGVILDNKLPMAPSKRMDLWFLWFASQSTRQWAAHPSRDRNRIRRWQRDLAKRLVSAQNMRGKICRLFGSWDPKGPWGEAGGRVYSTALSLMTLLRLGYTNAAEAGLDEVFKSKKEPQEVRLRALRAVTQPLSSGEVKGLRTLVRGKDPLLRLAGAEAISRLAPKSASLRKAIEKRLATEADEQVRAALLWALYRIGAGKESSAACVAALTPGSDPGLQFLRTYVLAAFAGTLPPEQEAQYAHLESADQVVRFADRSAELHSEKRAARASVALWRLLDTLDLPSRLDTAVERRLPFLESRHLIGAGVVEALEDLLSRRVWRAGGAISETKKLHATVLAGFSQAARAEQVYLRAVLALHLTESIRWAQAHVILGGVGMSMGDLQAYGFKTVDAARSQLKDLRAGVQGKGEESVQRMASFLSAVSVLRRFDMIETMTPEGMRAMLDSPRDIAEAVDEMEGTSASRFLGLAGARVLLTVSRFMGKSERSSALVELAALAAQQVAAGETETVDGRRAVVRALTLYAEAGLATVAWGAEAKLYRSDQAEERRRLPGLGRTAAEVDLLLAWAQVQKALGRDPAARKLAQEARERASALADDERVARAELLLK